MASKSKRARLAPQRDPKKSLIFWASAIFLIKLIISFNIPTFNIEINGKPFLLDGIWLGADGENYLKGYAALEEQGIFSSESTLTYWPAGYPLIILFISIFSGVWTLTSLAIVQSLIYSFASCFLAIQLGHTRLKKYSEIVLIFLLINPTLSLSSLVLGYESLTASGFLIILSVIIKCSNSQKKLYFIFLIILNSLVLSLINSMQPRLLASGFLIAIAWGIFQKTKKATLTLISTCLILQLLLPAGLVYRNHKAVGINNISTNLATTMNIGAGKNATGGYMKEGYGVICKSVEEKSISDSEKIKCILEWYVENPTKSLKLFYNKTVFFWSPWSGPLANGTMARNPWLMVNPIKNITTTQDGLNLVYGRFGKIISWIWLLGGFYLLIYGLLILLRQKSLERFIGFVAIILITTNWFISLFSIGDHRFRIPIMGATLLLQAIGFKTLLAGRKPAIVDAPSLR
jgi:hypothetical protein